MALPMMDRILQGPYDPADMDERTARARWAEFRRASGFVTYGPLLTPPAGNAKTAKNERATFGLALAPADASGVANVCERATVACRNACVLVTAGKGRVPNVVRARAVRTEFLATDPQAFVTVVASELRAGVAKYGAIGFRPNVAADIRWERVAPALLTMDGVHAYDYTKYDPTTERDTLGGRYRLVYSVSERPGSDDVAVRYLQTGGTVAVVFAVKRGHALPATWNGFPVVDGDETDDRTGDPAGSVVGLRAKGDARGIVGGGPRTFVRSPLPLAS